MSIKENIDTSIDGHVHSRLCHHAKGELEEYVLAGVERGLAKIIFLEHFEAGISYFESTWLTAADFAYYHQEVERLQKKYQGVIEIGAGVEVGFNPNCIDETIEFLKGYQWDRVGLSYHFLETKKDHVNMVSRRQGNLDIMGRIGVDDVISAYFQGLYQAVNSIPADVLCHLDAVLRHYPAISFNDVHYEMIWRIFAVMQEKDIALEINTSGFDLRGEPYPGFALIKQAQKKGIRLVAGSDAHRPRDVGRYFDALPERLIEVNLLDTV